MTRPLALHVTTADMSLELLLGPQLRAFRDAGYDVAGASAPGPFTEGLERGGIRHLPLRHATRSFSLGHDALALIELYRLFRELRPDLVHTHNPKPGVYGRLAARLARVPAVVNTQHGLYASSGDRGLRRSAVHRLERLAARCSHAELVQNPEDLETLVALGVPRSKLHLLGNGIDLDRFDPERVTPDEREAARHEVGASPSDVVVGAVGRLVREKGYAEVFEAARRLTRRELPLTWIVVGPRDPDKGDALVDAEMEEVQRDAGVRFLGMRRDMEALYAAMDLYVLASHREGFPRSAMEAAAMGLPVVATDVRGCRQVVDHDVTGVLVPPRDPAALADAVAELAADPGRRRAMGQAARHKARVEFDQQRVVDLTLTVYARLLGDRAPGAATGA